MLIYEFLIVNNFDCFFTEIVNYLFAIYLLGALAIFPFFFITCLYIKKNFK